MRAVFDDFGNKRCASCKVYKDTLHFSISKHSKNGTLSYCKKCITDKKREKNKTLEYKAVRRSYDLKSKYGLTQEDYISMFHTQNGKCLICLSPLNMEDYRRCVVDHCHTSNAVRGLLCINCNIGLGAFKDSIDNLERAKQYITKGGIK